MIAMGRWLATTALALGLFAGSARAQVFKPRDGSKSADKSQKTDKTKSEPKKVAAKKPSGDHPAPKHARRTRHGDDDPDFVKITDDGDDE